MKNKFFIVIVILFLIIGFIYFNRNSFNNIINLPQTTSTLQVIDEKPTTTRGLLHEPIQDARTRVTKKPFGIKVSPTNSPVSPEKFNGYHTGVDFETRQAEQNIDIPIYAICDGSLLLKKIATGYGGVVVQDCIVDNENVTIIYGHLRLDSVVLKVGEKLVAGDQIGILGKEYSAETSDERKHLHLGIHKGVSINILGYIQNQELLSEWLDVFRYL
ncbi:MAG: M23 family metallopeptidase [Candidatus ainarchaeum sp.]|nr:M23 family metallopeptidase [Candidatus ainarchaeum sp.]